MEESRTPSPTSEKSSSEIKSSDSFQELMQIIKNERTKESTIISTDGNYSFPLKLIINRV